MTLRAKAHLLEVPFSVGDSNHLRTNHYTFAKKARPLPTHREMPSHFLNGDERIPHGRIEADDFLHGEEYGNVFRVGYPEPTSLPMQFWLTSLSIFEG
jgi:hypothetical protein